MAEHNGSETGGTERRRNVKSDMDKPQVVQIQKLQAYTGLIFVVMAVLSFGAAIVFVVMVGVLDPVAGLAPEDSIFLRILENNPEATFLMFAAIVGSFLGGSLLRTALRASKQTIPNEDRDLLEPLIMDKSEEAINQYVRISSLLGSTGTFTKLGFTGLPLVTASLGLLLIVLALLWSSSGLSQDLMDLATLVIGAFIGSFVQRNVERGSGSSAFPEDMS